MKRYALNSPTLLASGDLPYTCTDMSSPVINPAPLTLPLWLGVPTPHVIPSSGEWQGPYTHNKLTDGTMSRY